MVCQNCTDRCLNCHSTCEKYLEYKAEIQKKQDNKRQYFPVNDYTYDEHRKAMKNYRKKFRK